MSTRPGPATSSPRRPQVSATVAASAVDASCGRCEVSATTRSCSSGSMLTGMRAECVQPVRELAGLRRCPGPPARPASAPRCAPRKRSASADAGAALLFAGHGMAAQKLAARNLLRARSDDLALGAAGIGDQRVRAHQRIQMADGVENAADGLRQEHQVALAPPLRRAVPRDRWRRPASAALTARGRTDAENRPVETRLRAEPARTKRRSGRFRQWRRFSVCSQSA